jgi:hypothetical protein
MGFTHGGILAGGAMIGVSTAMSLIRMGIPDETLYPVATAIVTGGFLLDQLFRENKYTKLFRMCGLTAKDGKAIKTPIVIKKTKSENITTLVIHLPEGLSQSHFEQKKQELEQALNAKIEFGFNKNLIMKLIEFDLKTKYDYAFEERDDPTETFIAYTHEGKFYFDIDKATQTIIAGEPNSGKSSLLRTIILSLILSKHDVDIHLIDFQDAELGIFQDCKKVKSYGKTPEDFGKLLDEMEEESERRLKLFASVRKKHYIQKLSVWNKHYPDKAMPYKIIMIDEFSRIADNEDLQNKFRVRVAMDRKAGILYLASMQRPDVKIISGSIKGCMPTRIAFKVVTDTDSEVILDVDGAEKIKNKGRCLMKYLGELKEVQCLYIEPDDVRNILKKHKAYKSKEEFETEARQQKDELAAKRKEQIEEWRRNNKNPY